MSFHSIEDAITAIKKGEMIIVVDDESRENEGDLVFAAEHATAEKLAFTIRHTGGVVCLSLAEEIADQLQLPDMVQRNTSKHKTPFTVSIEASEGVTTGISAEDRAVTIQKAVAPDAKPSDLSHPGHVFPLRAQKGGVLWRAGHTEASVDFCKLAGLREAAVISELMHDDGTMMRGQELIDFAMKHNIKIVSIADLISYRSKTETFITLEAETVLDTKTGPWDMKVYCDHLHHVEHVALVKGEINANTPTLVRVHSECLTGDTLGSMHCDCGPQLQAAMKQVADAGSGVVLYMQQEGRGIGLINKIRAYKLQREEGMDTVEANLALGFPEDLREFGIGAQILAHVGLKKIRLMTNNPKKLNGIQGYGLDIVEQVPIEVGLNKVNRDYLKTKKTKMGHLLTEV